MSDATEFLAGLDTVLVFDEAALREITSAAGMTPMELLELFFDDTDANIGHMAQALAAGDQATFNRAAHSLKSSAGNVGAQRVALAALALEKQTKQAFSEETAALFDQLNALYQDFTHTITGVKETLLA